MFKTRFISMLVLLAAVVTGAVAQDQWDSGDCTVTISDDVMTVSGTGAMEDYYDYNYTPWYGYDIKTIVIESGVTSIGNYAFGRFYNLESLSIPASVTSIGTLAFQECGYDAAALTVSFAEGSTPLTIGEGAFSYANLKSIDIPNRVTSIGERAFTNCSNLESVSIPASVTSIGNFAFYGCGSYAEALTVSFAEGSTPLTISENAFYESNLTSIDIPNRVTSIGVAAFVNCTHLESVSIPASVTSIGDVAFGYCGMLANVYIYAPSLTTYGADAFAGNAAGRKIYVLPNAVDTYKAGWPDYAADIEAMTLTLYATSLKEGTEDAANWTITPAEATTTGVEAGTEVKATYGGTKKVKSVKAVKKAAASAYTLLSAATTSDYGKVVCAAGHLHDAKTAVPDGCTAVGILGKVTTTGHGLILALQDATEQTWNTINGWTSVDTYAGTTLKVLPDDDARGSLTSYTTLGSTAVSNWAVAQKSDYEAIFTNLGSTTADSDGTTYDSNVDAYITTGVGGTAISDMSWSATEYDSGRAWDFESRWWAYLDKDYSRSVRPVLAF